MNTILFNAFATVCAFANPTDCRTYIAVGENPAGYTLQACEIESREVVAKWIDVAKPGYLVARVRCEFVKGQGA